MNGTPFNFSHYNRDDPNLIADLGESLLKLSEITPGGILVFFPSYQMIQNYYDEWINCGIIDRLSEFKGVYMEPRQHSQYIYVIQSYYQDIYSGKGAIIFAVCRGKISEGLDFCDDAARAVCLIGVPYP